MEDLSEVFLVIGLIFFIIIGFVGVIWIGSWLTYFIVEIVPWPSL